MPSPQPLSSPRHKATAVTLDVNGKEPSFFSESTPNLLAHHDHGFPDHIKPDKLSEDELRSLARQQLEYYFSG